MPRTKGSLNKIEKTVPKYVVAPISRVDILETRARV